ncbi:MAG: MOSC domain-containing protein [Pikeienuella sp.]
MEPSPLQALLATHAGPGRVMWIGVRPAKRAPMAEPSAAEIAAAGLVGDRRLRPGARAVTLMQAEHLPVIAGLARTPWIRFADLRRNIAVAGLNIGAWRGRKVELGSAVIEITGPCAPCSRMEAALGPGGYSALRGHGGVTAAVITEGAVRLGDLVRPI